MFSRSKNAWIPGKVIDVDTKDSSLGMSCPPAAFLAPDYLRCLRASLDGNGILIVNIVARSEELYDGAIKSLEAVFPGGITSTVLRAPTRSVMVVRRSLVCSPGRPRYEPTNETPA